VKPKTVENRRRNDKSREYSYPQNISLNLYQIDMPYSSFSDKQQYNEP